MALKNFIAPKLNIKTSRRREPTGLRSFLEPDEGFPTDAVTMRQPQPPTFQAPSGAGTTRFLPPEAYRSLGLEPEEFLRGTGIKPTLRSRYEETPFFQKVEAPVIGAVKAPLFNIGGVDISAGDITALGLIGFGAYQGARVLPALFKQVGDKALQGALNTGLDKWIAQRSRGVPAQSFKTAQDILYNAIAKNRTWLQQRATENMLSRMGRGINKPQAATQAVENTIKNFENDLLPKITVTNTAVPGQKFTMSQIISGLSAKAPPSVQAVQAGRMELTPEVPPTAPVAGVTPPEVAKPITTPEVAKYVYHGTTQGALRKIVIEGIKPTAGGQVSLSSTEQYAKTYADRKGGTRGIILRVRDKGQFLPDEKITEAGDYLTREAISPNDIEVKMPDGSWQPLTNVDASIGVPELRAVTPKAVPPPTSVQTGLPTEAGQPEAVPPEAPQAISEGITPEIGAVPPTEVIPPTVTPPAQVAPPIEPPVPPIAEVIPQEPIKPPTPSRPSVVGELPLTEDALRYFRVPTKAKALARTPGIKQIVSVFDKKLLADDPIKQAKILQAKLKDMSDSYQGVATAGVNSIMAKGGKPKTAKGIVIDKRITPLGNAPQVDGKPSMHIHDIVEFSERYTMPDKYRAYFNELRQVSRETTAMLEKELAKHDIVLRKMAGESDWVYLRRVVDKVGDIEAYGKGRWKGTQKPRSYKTAEAGVEAKKPITYLDPEKELHYQLESAYNWIIDIRVKEMLSELTTTAKARVPAKYINDLIDKTHQKVAADKLVGNYNYPSLITRAGRGEVLAPQTMAQIKRSFPDVADKLSRLIEKGAKPKEFTALKKSFQETADEIRYKFTLSKNAYKEALRQAGPRIDEAWGVYLPGKIFTTQELAGKEVLGRDIMREVEKTFGYNRPGTAAKVTKVVGNIGGILRQTKAALDLSVQGIQTLGALGLDTMNLMKMPARFLIGRPAKPTASWIRGAFRGWERLFSPKTAKAWADLSEIKQIQLEMIEHGALLSQSEFAEATSVLSKIPVLGKLYEWTGAAFTVGRNASQTYLYIGERARALYGLKDPAAITKRLDELAEWSNLATGGLSTRAMGIGDTQQAVENILFFSTRLNRSVFGNILHTVEGNYTGQMARDSIAGLVVAVVAFITGMSLALGQKPRLNPLPESQGGDGAKFLTVKVGEGYIGVGSTYYTLARLMANIYAATQDNPKDLLKLDMGNPIVRFVRSKFGPPMALGVDFITGHDYLGELTRDNLGTVAKTLGDWGIPIWSETLIEKDGVNIPDWDESARAAAEFLGGRTVPETDWDKVKIMRQIYSEQAYGKKFEDLNQFQIKQLMRDHPDLSEMDEKQKAHWVETGDAFTRTYDILNKATTEKRDAGLNRAAQALLDGKSTKYDFDKEFSYIRPYYSGSKAILWAMREGLDPDGVTEIERRYALSAKPEDKAMDDYKEYRAELIDKSELPKDWDNIDSQLISYLMRYDKGTQDYIVEHQDDWILDLPEPARTIVLQRAAGIEDETWWDNYRGSTYRPSAPRSPQNNTQNEPYKFSLEERQPVGSSPSGGMYKFSLK